MAKGQIYKDYDPAGPKPTTNWYSPATNGPVVNSLAGMASQLAAAASNTGPYFTAANNGITYVPGVGFTPKPEQKPQQPQAQVVNPPVGYGSAYPGPTSTQAGTNPYTYFFNTPLQPTRGNSQVSLADILRPTRQATPFYTASMLEGVRGLPYLWSMRPAAKPTNGGQNTGGGGNTWWSGAGGGGGGFGGGGGIYGDYGAWVQNMTRWNIE